MRMFRNLLVFSLVFLMTGSFALDALAARAPRPSQIDHRVRTIMYQPDEVFSFIGHYGFQSSIEFEPDESIQAISMGDSTAWMLQPQGNRLFLKPIEQSATTNMTLLTDKRSYLFELHAREARGITDPNMTFVMRFLYPSTKSGGLDSVTNYLDSVPEPDVANNPGKYNFNYTISGPDIIAPLRIFDDGQFTYFQFRNNNTIIPAFFTVDYDGNEALINYRARGEYIVVEQVANRMTLRHGRDIVCVFNESFPDQLRPTRRGTLLDQQQNPSTAAPPGSSF